MGREERNHQNVVSDFFVRNLEVKLYLTVKEKAIFEICLPPKDSFWMKQTVETVYRFTYIICFIQKELQVVDKFRKYASFFYAQGGNVGACVIE